LVSGLAVLVGFFFDVLVEFVVDSDFFVIFGRYGPFYALARYGTLPYKRYKDLCITNRTTQKVQSKQKKLLVIA
jgi:hypothetical protein